MPTFLFFWNQFNKFTLNIGIKGMPDSMAVVLNKSIGQPGILGVKIFDICFNIGL